MIQKRRARLWAAVFGLLSLAADRQIAMRVEVEPLEREGDGVRTAVSILVAPEDRGVLGEDVMVWAELSRNEERVARRGWAIKIDDPDRPLRIESVWPQGDFVLRVDVEGTGGRARGVWWADITVSDPSATSTGGDRDDPREPPPPETAVAEAAPIAVVPNTPPPENIDPEVDGSKTGTVTESVTQPVSASEPVAKTTIAAVPEPTPDPVVSAPVTEPVPVPVAEITIAAVPEPAPDSVVSAAIVEPPPSVGPQSVDAVAKNEPEASEVSEVDGEPFVLPETTAAPAETVDRLSELTIAVTRDDQPVLGLSAVDLEIGVGRSNIPILGFDGPDKAPLVLGIAVDLHSDSAPDLPWIGRMMAGLAERAGHGRGMVFVRSTAGADSGWDLDPTAVAGVIDVTGESSESGLPGLVEESLDRFQRRSGRAFLLVLTDGRRGRQMGSWKGALQAAETTGVPVYVAGIWNAAFGQGVRKHLRKLADLSGGGVFYVQGADQLDDLLARFGTVLDGSYVATVGAPAGTIGVRVSMATTGDAEVRASTTVR